MIGMRSSLLALIVALLAIPARADAAPPKAIVLELVPVSDSKGSTPQPSSSHGD